MLPFCLLVCVFMLFMLVKFSRKKKKKSKIGPDNLYYHTTYAPWTEIEKNIQTIKKYKQL